MRGSLKVDPRLSQYAILAVSAEGGRLQSEGDKTKNHALTGGVSFREILVDGRNGLEQYCYIVSRPARCSEADLRIC